MLGALLLGSACASPPVQFQRANASQAELDLDLRSCRSESARLTKDLERRKTNAMIDSGSQIGAGSIQTDQLASDLREAMLRAVEQCMAGRGWTQRRRDAS